MTKGKISKFDERALLGSIYVIDRQQEKYMYIVYNVIYFYSPLYVEIIIQHSL